MCIGDLLVFRLSRGLRDVLCQLPSGAAGYDWSTPYVPFDLLWPRLVTLIHHGGVDTMVQSLAFGTPLITSFAHNQFDNTARVVKLGVRMNNGPDRSSVALGSISEPDDEQSDCDKNLASAGSRRWTATRRRWKTSPTPSNPLDRCVSDGRCAFRL